MNKNDEIDESEGAKDFERIGTGLALITLMILFFFIAADSEQLAAQLAEWVVS
jgi:hypothetical protein